MIVSTLFWIGLALLLFVILKVISLGSEFETENSEQREYWKSFPARSHCEFGREYSPVHWFTAAKVRVLVGQFAGVSAERLPVDTELVQPMLIDDSLGIVEFLMCVEDRFALRLSDADLEPVRTLRDIIDLVVARKKQSR